MACAEIQSFTSTYFDIRKSYIGFGHGRMQANLTVNSGNGADERGGLSFSITAVPSSSSTSSTTATLVTPHQHSTEGVNRHVPDTFYMEYPARKSELPGKRAWRSNQCLTPTAVSTCLHHDIGKPQQTARIQERTSSTSSSFASFIGSL